MRGEWNGLQALVIKECPYAYYVHCFAHRLQLARVAASREVIPVHQFFNRLSCIINVICASSKRHDELQKSKDLEIKHLLELGEIKFGKGANQVGTLNRVGDTRWGSHFRSVCSLLKMFDATRVVLEGIIDDSSSYSQHADAAEAYNYLTSFEFVFILHLMKELMGRTNILSQELQKKSQDIGNAIDLASATKVSLDNFINKGWEHFIKQVCSLVEKYYRIDFTKQEMIRLKYEIELFNIEKSSNQQLPSIPTVSELCRFLIESKKSEAYGLIERLLRLILTLPVSTATTERAFLAMKICKNRLRNKMSDDFLASNLVVNIEREIAQLFDSEFVIDEFKNLKGLRAEL
ncbi:uncharacterized protein [Rutidosis leptorrhynchoides]|uniref:uncharacterized protein n=1 Tax=Rutidosis leptorrhynchoides TaxID=125765 RepID=UPI003A98FD20